MPRTSLPRFNLTAHGAGMLTRHPRWSTYQGLPWYETEFANSGKDSCTCCGQLMVAYTYNFRGTFCAALVNLARIDAGGGWVHYTKFVPPQLHAVATIRCWGLIEEKKDVYPDDKKTSGYWRLTSAGINFVSDNSVGIPKRVIQYLGDTIAFCGPLVNYEQCKAEAFKYSDVDPGEDDDEENPFG